MLCIFYHDLKKEKKEIGLKTKLPSRWDLGIWGFLFVFQIFWHGCSACGILVPQPGIKSEPLALEAMSLNHWTTREGQDRVLKEGAAVPQTAPQQWPPAPLSPAGLRLTCCNIQFHHCHNDSFHSSQSSSLISARV